jgi:hypothetical protein
MVRLLSDENFHGKINRGLVRRRPEIALVRVQDVGLEGATDPEVLSWAADDDRIVLTRDRSTMPVFANQRMLDGDEMPGLFVVSPRQRIREAIDELLLIDEASEHSEWVGQVAYLPL